MSDRKGAPLDCWTCKHRVAHEYGPSLAVGIVYQECRKFVRSDRFGNTDNLTCATAYDKFCGGGDWKPTFFARVSMRLYGKLKEKKDG
jgi:hypothetical protein